MGPDEMHPSVLRELADAVAKPFSIMFEKPRQSREVPSDWRKGNIASIFKRVIRRTLGTTNESASPPCPNRSLQGDHLVAFQYLKEAYKTDGDKLFTKACTNRTRGNGLKVKECRFILDIRKKCFTMRVVRQSNRSSREVVDALSLEMFKVRLDGALSSLI
ncbi:hypothetical protein QYF61_019289 [Mycteria americana]|uniref:Uncharacterized protein n=1 Tax=Mycteria americana TaxID=33587 RepID=A0AAN7S8D0_MYCAM|nr:hypothetical protein QYF61_019289 [Mycteria americana]